MQRLVQVQINKSISKLPDARGSYVFTELVIWYCR